MNQSLTGMTTADLLSALAAARQTLAQAEYIDGLAAWQAAVDAAQARINDLTTEIERRGAHG